MDSSSDWFYTPDVMAAAIKLGFATQEQFDGWRKELDLWKDHPGACGGLAFGHVIASKPDLTCIGTGLPVSSR